MKIIVISLGGSIINPGKIDYKFFLSDKQKIISEIFNKKVLKQYGPDKKNTLKRILIETPKI